MRLNFTATEKQKPFLDSTDRALLLLAGRGFGKTTIGSVKSLHWLSKKNSVGMIVGPSYKQLNTTRDSFINLLWDITYDKSEQAHLQSMKRDHGLPLFLTRYNKNEQMLTTVLGSNVYLRSADDPDSLRGYDLDWFWLDEPAIMKREALDNLRLALRRSEDAQYWLTTTPKGYNWVYELESQFTKFTGTTYDNLDNLPQSFLDDLPQDTQWARQEIFGEYVELEGLVFTEYLIADPLEVYNITREARGLDFGFSTPASIVDVAECNTEYGKITYVYNESYGTGWTVTDLGRLLSERGGLSELYTELDTPQAKITTFADPSLPANIEELRRFGHVVTKADNAVLSGIDRVKRCRLVVSPRCTNLIDELKQYVWTADNKPSKRNDHAIDAMRYAIMGMYKTIPAQTKTINYYKTDNALYNRLGSNDFGRSLEIYRI